MASKWNADFIDLVDLLNAEHVEYVIVGAFALAAHGFPRATGDIDFFVRPSAQNATRVVRALQRFGAPLSSAGVTEGDFAIAGSVYQIGVVPRRIDVITEISGVTFDEATASCLVREVDGRQVPFLGRDMLIRNKRATGRSKDLVDAEVLEPPTKK